MQGRGLSDVLSRRVRAFYNAKPGRAVLLVRGDFRVKAETPSGIETLCCIIWSIDPPEARLYDCVIEPCEVERWLPLFQKAHRLPDEIVATPRMDKVVDYGGRRYAIRPVMRMRPIDPEEWRGPEEK